MANPARGWVTVRVDEASMTDTLRALGRLPRLLNRELRVESKRIAEDVMVPAWKAAAESAGAPWGPLVAGSIRARSDRVPAVIIGKRSPRLAHGVDPIMARYPSSTGAPSGGTFDYSDARGSITLDVFPASGWLDATGAHVYGDEAKRRWGEALEAVLARWNAGGV